MARLFRYGLLGMLSIAAIGGLPLSCQSGGVGDPCTPEDEYKPDFSGYAMSEEYIESRSFQCYTRVCLVNHFQGRVSCPLGQSAAKIVDCGGPSGPDDSRCDTARGEKCVQASDNSYVCHKPGECQSAEDTDANNAGKPCCVPGSDTPVAVPTCSQCNKKSNRAAEQAVYCSCRCGVADGAPEEPNARFCTCPTGFSCTQIRRDLSLNADAELTGKYCVKEGTAYDMEASACGVVAGNHDPPCQGIGDTSQ